MLLVNMTPMVCLFMVSDFIPSEMTEVKDSTFMEMIVQVEALLVLAEAHFQLWSPPNQPAQLLLPLKPQFPLDKNGAHTTISLNMLTAIAHELSMCTLDQEVLKEPVEILDLKDHEDLKDVMDQEDPKELKELKV